MITNYVQHEFLRMAWRGWGVDAIRLAAARAGIPLRDVQHPNLDLQIGVHQVVSELLGLLEGA